MSKNLQFPAFRFQQGKRTLYLLALSAGELLKLGKVDTWNPTLSDTDPNQGYQRGPTRARCVAMGRYLIGRDPVVPLSILISARKPLKFEEFNENYGMLTIPQTALPLYIVDGQHRLCGFQYVIEELAKQEYSDFKIPVTVVEGLSKFEEMMQFHVINTTQKGIRTDLVRRLLVQQIQDPSRRRELVFEGKEWEARAAQVVAILNSKKDSPWYNRIQAPNAPRTGSEVIKETSFGTSLKPILNTDSFTGQLQVEDVAQLLTDYWKAWQSLCPEAFESPQDYVIQKTPGVFALHMVAPRVFQLCHAENNFSSEHMKEILKKARVDDQPINSEFWASEGGRAAAYGSMKGFRLLADQILEELPQLRVKKSRITVA